MEPEIKAEASSSSGLEFQLHPLVLINISDHHTRTKVNGPDQRAPARVVGCLLGQQLGRSVDIRNSFEVGTFPPDASQFDFAFLHKKLEQYKQVFPDLDVVGWYATGSTLGPVEMDIQRRIMELNESPVLLLLDTAGAAGPAAGAAGGGDLPVALYETELHVVEGAPSHTFARAGFGVATSEAERIGVDQVAKLLPSGASAGTDQLTSHLGGLGSAISALLSRVEAVAAVAAGMAEGRLPFDPEVARQCAAFAARLPAADGGAGGAFGAARAGEACDAALAVLLAGLTTGAAAAAALADKHNLAYERAGPAAKRGGKGGGSSGSLAFAGGHLGALV